MRAASILDYRMLAKRRLPKFLFEYVDGGAYAETTLRRNVSDLQDVVLRQRVLQNVETIDLTARLFGQQMSMPVMLAPIGLGGMMARRGEVQAARAAQAAGIPFCLSTVGACGIDEVAGGVTEPFWFQLYMIRDRAFMRDLLAKARAAGCSALVFTVDLPVPGTRYRDYRSGLAGAPGAAGALRRLGQALARPAWSWDVGVRGRPLRIGNLAPVLGKASGLDDYLGWLRDNFDPSITGRDLQWVRDNWEGPLIVKGILDPEDARMAADLGADGIVVSNHGGRQLDGVLSSARALEAVVRAVDGRLTVLADGGVRSGLDVVRMLALGASGVMIGRAWVYALAARGQVGVAHVLKLLDAEMRVAMALTGKTSLAQVDRSCLAE